MGRPVPYRWLAFMGIQLAIAAGGLFWWASWAHGNKGPVFLTGLGFLAACGAFACILLDVYHACCGIRRQRGTPPLE